MAPLVAKHIPGFSAGETPNDVAVLLSLERKFGAAARKIVGWPAWAAEGILSAAGERNLVRAMDLTQKCYHGPHQAWTILAKACQGKT